MARADGEVAWVDGTRRNVRLRLSPIDVGPALARSLWGEVTAVLTSATIPPRIVERVGLEGFPTEELNVGSPFDYRSHALLYVARHLPDRRAPTAEEALHEELALLLDAAGGRTLALFTSRRATEAAAEALAPELPYTLLVQGELPKGRLLDEFASDETSCLFATLGFWQGVDIPGRALSLVTIDRLPFPRPDDPLLQARRDRAGGRAFSLVDLPRAATLLAQGAGRLIRNATDRGVVAVLDHGSPPRRTGACCWRPCPHASLGGPFRGRDLPPPGARGRRGVGRARPRRLGVARRPSAATGPQRLGRGYSAKSKTSVPLASRVPSVATRITQRPATRSRRSRLRV